MFHFRVLLKKSGSRTPRVELEEMGPSLDFVMRRTHLASDDLMKAATKVPKAVKVITWTVYSGPVVQKVVIRAIQWVNHCPVDKY